jgi:signal transduction histidine kinase
LITHSIEWAARARYCIPVVVGLALVAMAVNEATFQHTWRTLSRGIALTDARIEAAGSLQAMTLMEAAARGVMAHDNPQDRQRFEQAANKFQASHANAMKLVAQVDNEGVVAVDKLRELSSEQAARYRGWMSPPAAVTPSASAAQAASATPSSRESVAELQTEYESVLSKAATLQEYTRVTLYDALMLSRLAVHALVLLSVLALVLFARQLRRSDAARAQEHERLAAQVEARTAELRDLADHLVSVREDERGRLARELHDEMGGTLTAMKLELARLRRVQGVPQAALERLASIDVRLNDGIAFKRRIVENLRPSSLDQLGLKVALEMLCADASSVMAVPVQVDVQNLRLGSDKDLTVFRIVQESLTNIAKYASARTVWVEFKLAEGGTARLTVRDDGRGFDTRTAAVGRHGLLGMQVRVESHQGSFSVTSQLGQGTQIAVTLPISPPAHIAAPLETAQPAVA